MGHKSLLSTLGFVFLVNTISPQAFANKLASKSLNPDKNSRAVLIGVGLNFLADIKAMPENQVIAFRKSLKPNDIFLLHIKKLSTPKDIEDTISTVSTKFPNQRIYIFPYAAQASLNFEPSVWKGIPAAKPYLGIRASTLAKLDGILIDHEQSAYCHKLDQREKSLMEHVRYNNIICSNPKFPKIENWASGYEASAKILNRLVNATKKTVRAGLKRAGQPNKPVFVGLIPSGMALVFNYYSSAALLSESNADGQIVQTQASCRESPNAFGQTVDKLISEYSEELKEVKASNENQKPFHRKNLGIQITLGKINKDNASVSVEHAIQCLKQINDNRISTILLFHMTKNIFVEALNEINKLRDF